MTTPGYPDYQRISLASGVLLGSFNGVASAVQTVFKGYVGNWQALNTTTATGAQTPSANYIIAYIYFTDDTFSVPFQGQTEFRITEYNGWSQHVPLSPWLEVQIQNFNGLVTTNIQWTMYGAQVITPLGRLARANEALLTWDTTIPANVQSQFEVPYIIPGRANISSLVQVVGGIVQLLYYSQSAAAFVAFWSQRVDNGFDGVEAMVVLPDAPIQVSLNAPPTGSCIFQGALVADF